MNLRTTFQTGNVVLWVNAPYIVKAVHDDGLELMPLDCCNVTCHPTMKWPTKNVCACGSNCAAPDECEYKRPVTDFARTVNTVVRLHDCVETWLVSRFKKVFLR